MYVKHSSKDEDKTFKNLLSKVLFKVVNRNHRTMCEICSKLTIKTAKRHHWRRLLLALNRFHSLFWYSVVDFKQLNPSWLIYQIMLTVRTLKKRMRADRRLHLMFFKRKLFFESIKKNLWTFTKCEDQSSSFRQLSDNYTWNCVFLCTWRKNGSFFTIVMFSWISNEIN